MVNTKSRFDIIIKIVNYIKSNYLLLCYFDFSEEAVYD